MPTLKVKTLTHAHFSMVKTLTTPAQPFSYLNP